MRLQPGQACRSRRVPSGASSQRHPPPGSLPVAVQPARPSRSLPRAADRRTYGPAGAQLGHILGNTKKRGVVPIGGLGFDLVFQTADQPVDCCSLPNLAQMRSADRRRKYLLSGADRTYGGNHETDAFDPNRTLEFLKRGEHLLLGTPLGPRAHAQLHHPEVQRLSYATCCDKWRIVEKARKVS